jgi:L-arabinonolactonase
MSNSPSGRLWAIQQDGVWTRWAPEHSRWDIYSETRLQIAADPSTPSACYFINPDGSVHWRDVDNDVNESFPGISAKEISVGGDNRLWAIQANGVWTRWAPEHSRWDIYSETRLQIAADPSTSSASYFINPDGSVHWRDVDNNVNKSFPGISAQAISVGGQ